MAVPAAPPPGTRARLVASRLRLPATHRFPVTAGSASPPEAEHVTFACLRHEQGYGFTSTFDRDPDDEQTSGGKAATAFTFGVNITGCAPDTPQVLVDRLGYDEDYGFTYTLEWFSFAGSSPVSHPAPYGRGRPGGSCNASSTATRCTRPPSRTGSPRPSALRSMRSGDRAVRPRRRCAAGRRPSGWPPARHRRWPPGPARWKRSAPRPQWRW